MPLTIEINQSGVQARSRITESHIKKVAIKTLRAIQKKNAHLSIALVTPKDIQQMNRVYRGKNKPTDVLAFPLEENTHSMNKDAYWGEVIVCPSIAKKQAHLFKNTLPEEINRLLIHGILHLAGYDHHVKKDAKIMFGLTDRILATLNS